MGSDQLADVFIYALMLADNLNLDVEKIIDDKIVVNSKKYPIKESFGTNKKYTEFKGE